MSQDKLSSRWTICEHVLKHVKASRAVVMYCCIVLFLVRVNLFTIALRTRLASSSYHFSSEAALAILANAQYLFWGIKQSFFLFFLPFLSYVICNLLGTVPPPQNSDKLKLCIRRAMIINSFYSINILVKNNGKHFDFTRKQRHSIKNVVEFNVLALK